MANRKQRKRREKEKRHEYELVLVDEDGEERTLESAELRAEKEKKDQTRKPAAGSKAASSSTSSSKRPIREVPPPSIQRLWKRTAMIGVLMFLVFNLVGEKDATMATRILLTLIYTLLAAPFLYLIDRMQYNQYLRQTGQAP